MIFQALKLIFFYMPLVVVCGIPGSGKTKRATELANHLTQTHKCHVVLINEESLGIDKNEGYKGTQMLRYRSD